MKGTVVTLTGNETVWNNLQLFSGRLKDKMMRVAMKETLEPLKREAKANCKSDLGITKDSIDTVVTAKGAAKGSYLVGIMGPKTNVRAKVKRSKTGLGLPPNVDIPTRRAHLQEFGHTVVNRKGKVIAQMPPNPFMRKAWDAYGGENALYTFADSMQKQILEATQ